MTENNYLQNQMNNPMEYSNRIEAMYPDVHRRMNPHVENVVNAFGRGRELTEDELNRMTNEVVRNSNVMSALPQGHNASTINDIARVLILANLFNGYDYYYPYPVYPPFFLFPFGGRFDHHRGFDRFHGYPHGGHMR